MIPNSTPCENENNAINLTYFDTQHDTNTHRGTHVNFCMCTYSVSRLPSPAKQLSPISLILLLWRCLEKQKAAKVRFSIHDGFKIISFISIQQCFASFVKCSKNVFSMTERDLWIRYLYYMCICRRLSSPNRFKVFSFLFIQTCLY